MLDENSFWVQVVKNDICICLMRSCEDYHLIVFVCFLETFDGIWSDINASLYRFAIGESYVDDVVARFVLNIVNAVDQRFIKIKNESLFNYFVSLSDYLNCSWEEEA